MRRPDGSPAADEALPAEDETLPAGLGRDRRPSIGDVARLVGVSHQTVSRVLNQHPSVRDITRARVLAAIDQLGYRPNTLARALASGRSRTLGVISLDTSLYGPVSTLLGLQQAAQRHGYFVSIVAVHSIDRHSVTEAVRRLTTQAVEGLAVIAPFATGHEALDYLPAGTPVVVVEGDPESEVSVVTVDQVAGGRLATEHLLAAGHATVFHVAGPAEWLEARGRTAGWRSALEKVGADVTPPLSGDWTPRSGYQAGQVLAQIRDATAIFVANDQMALGLLRALHDRGRQVPAEVAVVGFDDIPESPYFTPPLTTVHQDFERVGAAAVQILVDQLISGDLVHQRIVIPPELVCRQSSDSSSRAPKSANPGNRRGVTRGPR
jgi:DNA-binding LacI/PurR family transcriptional regulator